MLYGWERTGENEQRQTTPKSRKAIVFNLCEYTARRTYWQRALILRRVWVSAVMVKNQHFLKQTKQTQLLKSTLGLTVRALQDFTLSPTCKYVCLCWARFMIKGLYLILDRILIPSDNRRHATHLSWRLYVKRRVLLYHRQMTSIEDVAFMDIICLVFTCRGKGRGRNSAVRTAPDSWSKGCEFASQQERRENFLVQS